MIVRMGLLSLVALTAMVLSMRPAVAGALPLPPAAQAAKDTIGQQCPDCISRGVTPCGTGDVQFGKRFPKVFFAGKPARGYLPGFRMDAGEFTALARTLPYTGLMDSLRARFVNTPLVIVDDKFATTRVIAKTTDVEIIFPQPLHQCLADKSKTWGCCVGACQNECCEQSLGSPRIDLTWDDPDTGDKLTFHYSNTIGASTLLRQTAAGKTVLYWCVTTEAGMLQ